MIPIRLNMSNIYEALTHACCTGHVFKRINNACNLVAFLNYHNSMTYCIVNMWRASLSTLLTLWDGCKAFVHYESMTPLHDLPHRSMPTDCGTSITIDRNEHPLCVVIISCYEIDLWWGQCGTHAKVQVMMCRTFKHNYFYTKKTL